MVLITRRFQFCAGHRVYQHEGKCRHLHGHNYVAHITLAGPGLDPIGRVIDFGEVKEVIGTWIDSTIDHGFLIYEEDREAEAAMRLIDGQRMTLLPFNPTAENLAPWIAGKVSLMLGHRNIRCTKLVLEETENCSATFEDKP